MSGAHIVENMNTENTNISRTTASKPTPPPNKKTTKQMHKLKNQKKK
ncbi:M-protein [Helicobacter pylori]|nr:M-protein [Helicobacter pylori]